jgi:hypothetical protein
MSNVTVAADTINSPVTPGLHSRWLDVTVLALDSGNPLRQTYTLALTLQNGTTRHVSKTVVVTDAALQERLRQEMKPGERTRVHLETDWDDEDIPTVLKDFCSP